ncbi:hypothetical protein [Erwinia phage vB_Ea277G]|nr:hypothetical protein [Erwinia phage vB_Ea277G]
MKKNKPKGFQRTVASYTEWAPPLTSDARRQTSTPNPINEALLKQPRSSNGPLVPQVAFDAVTKDWARLYPDKKLDKEMHYQLALRKHLAFEKQHPMVSGKLVFEMKATHGLPFDVIFGQIILERNSRVNWVEFVDTALENGWLINNIVVSVRAGLEDASIHREYIDAVIQRIKLYITKKFEVENAH